MVSLVARDARFGGCAKSPFPIRTAEKPMREEEKSAGRGEETLEEARARQTARSIAQPRK
jgi:hypothetical protein